MSRLRQSLERAAAAHSLCQTREQTADMRARCTGSDLVARPAPRTHMGGHPPQSGYWESSSLPHEFQNAKGRHVIGLYSEDVFPLSRQKMENPYSWVITMHI